MSDTVVSSQEDSKRNREGSKSEERKEEKKDTRKKKEKKKKKQKLRKNQPRRQNHTWLLSCTQKIKPSKKKCIMPFAQKSHSFSTKKNGPTDHICSYERYPNKRYHCKRMNDLNLTYRFVLIFS